MKRVPLFLAIAAVLALALAACGGNSNNGGSTPAPTSTSHAPVTLTVWHPWTVPSEKNGFKNAVAGFTKQYPWITLKIIGFPDSATFDQQLIKAVQGGGGPDVAISFGPDFVGQYAHDGLWLDLKPYLARDNVPTDQFAPAALTYCQFENKEVALPVLTDAYGLYYNKDMFAKAGIAGPPKTMDELMADAQQLTVKKADGSIKIAGFVPLDTWEELDTTDLARAWGGQYFDASNQSQLATDPAWAAAMKWQKQLVDWYGYNNILKFFSTYTASEFSASNAFETGKVAMVFDGEWRTAMIKGDASKVNYGTAPFPAAADHPDVYGSGRVGGTITGIPKNSAHPDDAWLLVKYMATNSDFLVALANNLGNVPTTKAAASSPTLKMPPQFQTFIDIWNNPKSSYAPPITTQGNGYASLLTTFDQKWVAGKVSDLVGGLKQVDTQVANQLQLGTAP